MKNNNFHESVMISEVIEGLHIQKGNKYIDCTAGNGGHLEAILQAGGLVLGIDLDPAMIAIANERLGSRDGYKIVQGNFTDIEAIAKNAGFYPANGILFDLGVTNLHLLDLERGFSFGNPEAPLDMRLDRTGQGVRGADLLNVLREDQLRSLFEVTLDIGAAKWIAGRVLHSREAKPVETVGDLLEICEGIKTGKKGLNEATLPFLALRIAVNSELDNLRQVLPKAYDLLDADGRLVVISFHSKEDEIVKSFFKEKSQAGAKLITFTPLAAGQTEIEVNRRARSAKMRILQKI